MSEELVIVNMVGSGQINREVDLEALRKDIPLENSYITGPGLYFKFDEQGPTTVLARSGKYFITGADSFDELEDMRRQTLQLFVNLGVIETPKDTKFSIKNIVSTGCIGESLDLSALAISIGLGYVEYEPEQFPGLIYRHKPTESVALVFASGKIVITGVKNQDIADRVFSSILDLVDNHSII